MLRTLSRRTCITHHFTASIHYHHPSWKKNRPVEFWCYTEEVAASKLILLKDLKLELMAGSLDAKVLSDMRCTETSEQNNANKNRFNVSRWFLFPGRDEATMSAISKAFEIEISARNFNKVSRSKVEFVMGSTRNKDYLMLCVHDLRLQQHESDGEDGDVDDVAWLQVRACELPLVLLFQTWRQGLNRVFTGVV